MEAAPDTGAGEKTSGATLRWHVLGGNNSQQIGANCGLCVYEDADEAGQPRRKTLLFDIGILSGHPRTPEDPALAEADILMPDPARFFAKAGDPQHAPAMPVDAIFLTHNHIDHMGAIPFLVLMGYKLPRIYATPYTARRLEQELSNAGLEPAEWPEISAIAPGKAVMEGPVSVTPFWVSHSTPQSAGFFIETPQGNILNPGDFKLDQSVLWGPAFSEEQFRHMTEKPVDLLLLDSTGADKDIAPVTEQDLRDALNDLADKHASKRLIVAVMSGYEENLASVAAVAAEHDRTLWICGGAHEQTLAALADTGMSLDDHVGQEVDLRVLGSPKSARDLAEGRPRDALVVVTGAQGHNNAALTRAAEGRHNALHLDPKTDVILICAAAMPGQEASREKMISGLRAKGFKVVTRDEAPLYSHAHARLGEIVELVKMANPKNVLPVHGSKDLRESCAAAMEKMGRQTLRADNGAVLQVGPQGTVTADPALQGKAELIGLKTLQGTGWNDRCYLLLSPAAEKPPANKPANGNARPRPKIYFNAQ